VDKRLNVEDVLNTKPVPPGEEASPQPGEPFLRRLEFNLLDAQRRMLEAEARGAKSAMLPQLSAVFQYGIDSNAVLIHDRGYAAFVSLDIPIFDWLKAHNDSKQFRLRARQITTNRAITERTFSREYANALARVKDLYRQIEITNSQVELAKENLRLSRIRYEGGEGSMLAVVTAQNRQAQAQTNYYTAVASYLNARVDLEVAAGR
jgi:outer membrane protein TolC